MPDERTYIRLHDGMPDHPKIDGLSDAAFRLLITMWCWSSRHLTDGRVPEVTWLKRGSRRAREELVTAGLIEQLPDGVMSLHDYLEHQRSADEVAALREKRRLAGSKGGKAKANAIALAKDVAKQTASKNVAESETELTRDTSSKDSVISTAEPRFAEFWDTYPRRVGKPDALRAFAKAVRRAEAADIIAGAKRYRDDPNRDDAYTAHPATWLNRDGWNDEPIPARGSRAREDDPMGWAR